MFADFLKESGVEKTESVAIMGWIPITERKKELIITAGGENVAPVFIENAIKKNGTFLFCFEK
jgi:long-subunit acyl-CoA synthetase (AMP-forming)